MNKSLEFCKEKMLSMKNKGAYEDVDVSNLIVVIDNGCDFDTNSIIEKEEILNNGDKFTFHVIYNPSANFDNLFIKEVTNDRVGALICAYSYMFNCLDKLEGIKLNYDSNVDKKINRITFTIGDIISTKELNTDEKAIMMIPIKYEIE